jgi:prepilin-type processing-associated H-X9-DG protein/prepilin-type N-terminal cleavage/methylation domain-containing protein
MRLPMRSRRKLKPASGFTLSELLVAMGVGAVLTGLLFADLTQTRTTLLRQACAANLKQWGMAIYLYSQDYNGTYFYSCCGSVNFDDISSPYARYLGESDPTATMRTMRVCPAVAARRSPQSPLGAFLHTYAMPIPRENRGGSYVTVAQDQNGFLGFNLRSVPFPSQYLLLIDSKGNTLTCGGLKAAVTQINTTTGDSITAIDRHGGGVNCLFGDFHVEWVSSQTISNQDAVNCATGNPWFMMN